MKIVVLGGGIAGLMAIETVRRYDQACEITLICEEAVYPYSRPMLSKTSFRSFDTEVVLLKSPSWYQVNNICVMLSTVVMSIDTHRKTILTTRGCVAYDKCIYSLGSSCFVPPIKHSEESFVLRSSQDFENIKKNLPAAKNIAIIGGGVIGLEIAIETAHLGKDVTVYETANRLMPRLLDEESGNYLQSCLESLGVKIVVDSKIADIHDLGVDLVIMSCGVRPNTKIAQAAGIDTDHLGIIVDEFMQTNIQNIFACGDCASFHGKNSSLWKESINQGVAAGKAACKVLEPFEQNAEPVIMNTPSFSLFAIGDMNKSDSKGGFIEAGCRFEINARNKKTYIKKIYTNGALTGACLIGSLEKMFELIEEERRSNA